MVHKAKALWKQLEDLLTEPELAAALVVFLGDYCDRGLHTRELLSWLIGLRSARERLGGRTVFLIGNHEFCLLGFLGLLPRPDRQPLCRAWGREELIAGEQERWWGDGEPEELLDEVHLQGRRWAGGCYERSYGSPATFASYGAAHGDRAALLGAMPQDHLEFLQECPWVYVEENRLMGRLIFVHAGLEADGTLDCEEQVRRLQEKDASVPQPEPLFGREGVLHTPTQLAITGVTVVSGHHGKVLLKNFRVIVDSCSGDERNALAAVVMPEMLLVYSTGKLEPGDASRVWPDRSLSRLSQSPRYNGSGDGTASVASTASVRTSTSSTSSSEGSRMAMPRGDETPLAA